MNVINVHGEKVKIQSTLHTTPDWCKNASLAAIFGRNGISYTISTQSDTCMYSMYVVHVLHNIEMLVG